MDSQKDTDCVAMSQAWDKRNSQSIILVTEDSLLNNEEQRICLVIKSDVPIKFKDKTSGVVTET